MSSALIAKSLYRSLLRAHQTHLSQEMRQVGDAYIKAEFRLHKSASPKQAQTFITEWTAYLDQIVMTAKLNQSFSTVTDDSSSALSFGRDLPPDVELTKEQKLQLNKLKDASKP
jgi:Complex1_LYR-like